MATSKKTSKTAAAPEPAKVIDQSIKNDRSVELRGSVPLNAHTVAQIQRGLLLQAMAKKDDPSSVKLYLGPSEANRYRQQDEAALADTMLLACHPVDTIVRSGLLSDGLKAFLSATGKRYMSAGAVLHVGVASSTAPYGKNKANQVRRQLFNDFQLDLQTLIMIKAGVTERQQVYTDLISAKGFNALQALYYGSTGLIDGILINHDQVITRGDLTAYYEKQNMNATQIQDFNQHYINVYDVPTRPLASVAPLSIPQGMTTFYKSLKKPPQPIEEKQNKNAAEKTKNAKSKPAVVPVDGPVFYIGEKKLDDYPLMVRANKDKTARRIMVDSPASYSNGILDDDTIFFNDGFRDETAEQIGEALIALDHKKATVENASHIKIIENSPGGSVWSGQELRSLIRSLMTPVDVIVQGMGASCGSWLLCSATGNRFATPNARIMFHEAATEIRNYTPHNHYNEIHDDLDQSTLDYIAIVAQSVGRAFDEVLKDFDHDVWLNPVESLFYGDNGLIDAILVGHNKVITRSHVEAYLLKQFKTKAKLQQYIEAKLIEKRDPRLGMAWKPEDHNETDPFDNPLKIIDAVAQINATLLTDIPRFKLSVPTTASQRTIDYFNVMIDEDKK